MIASLVHGISSSLSQASQFLPVAWHSGISITPRKEDVLAVAVESEEELKEEGMFSILIALEIQFWSDSVVVPMSSSSFSYGRLVRPCIRAQFSAPLGINDRRHGRSDEVLLSGQTLLSLPGSCQRLTRLQPVEHAVSIITLYQGTSTSRLIHCLCRLFALISPFFARKPPRGKKIALP